MNRKVFYDSIREEIFGGRLIQDQVDGFERILDYHAQNFTYITTRELAYILATVYHETAKSMQPVLERGSQKYLRKKKYWPYIGTGLIQVTWEYNYKKFGFKVPQDGLNWDKALYALFYGMHQGLYTGKKLSHYFGLATGDNPVQARRIVNGVDQAVRIASVYEVFLKALQRAEDALVDLPQEPIDDSTATIPGGTAGPVLAPKPGEVPVEAVKMTVKNTETGMSEEKVAPYTSDLKPNVDTKPDSTSPVDAETQE